MTSSLIFLQSTARSGTTWLTSLLASNKHITAYNEFMFPSIFDWGFYKYYADCITEDSENIYPKNYKKCMGEYFEWMKKKSKTKKTVLGIKLEQINEIPIAMEPIIASKSSFIILRRLNLLKQVVSEFIMYERIRLGDTVVHRDYEPEPISVNIDSEKLISRMQNKESLFEKYFTMIKNRGCKYHVVDYESLVGPDCDAYLDDLFSFMSIPKGELSTTLKKQNSAPLQVLVKNYAEIERSVRASRFAYCLHLEQ